MSLTREDLEVGESYKVDCMYGAISEVLFFTEKNVLSLLVNDKGEKKECFERIEDFLDEHVKINQPKKRYWLWDLKDINSALYKCASYMDDEGIGTNGERAHDKQRLARKHENEFIEV